MTESLSDEQKKEVFKVLVDTQDSGATVLESRTKVAKKFNLGVDTVVAIERAGIANKWPPLDAQVAGV